MKIDFTLPPNLPSEKKFGLFFASLGILLCIWQFFLYNRFSLTIFCISFIFALLSFIAPVMLRPLNIGWFYLGKILHHVMNPVILAVIFFGIITPLSILRRIIGKEGTFSKNYNPHLKSYWVCRTPAGPSPDSLSDQF